MQLFNKRHLSLLASLVFLAGCDTIVMRPFGDVAAQQADLIRVSTYLMLLIIVPVIALTILFAWRYRASNKAATYTPDWDHSTKLELVIWGAPLLIIIALGLITWISTHLLDPYRPISRLDENRPLPADAKVLDVQVVALDWKWLFIYPEQGIATVNELVTPVDTQIRFSLSASTVMNAFYIPALAGQIYAMPGMETKLHAVLNRPGVYEGFSSNYSGAGFSHMRFKYRGVSNEAFAQWVQEVKSGSGELSRAAYVELEKPSERDPVQRFASVDAGLFKAVVERCVAEGQPCMTEHMAMSHRKAEARAALNAKLKAEQEAAMCVPEAVQTAALNLKQTQVLEQMQVLQQTQASKQAN